MFQQRKADMNTNILTVLILCLIPLCAFGTTSSFKDCGKRGKGSIISVNINNCTGSGPCVLKKGSNAGIEVVFKAAVDAKTSTSKAFGILARIPIPFPLPDKIKNGCNGMSPHCPIKKGTQYKYTTALPVSSSYPSPAATDQTFRIAHPGSAARAYPNRTKYGIREKHRADLRPLAH